MFGCLLLPSTPLACICPGGVARIVYSTSYENVNLLPRATLSFLLPRAGAWERYECYNACSGNQSNLSARPIYAQFVVSVLLSSAPAAVQAPPPFLHFAPVVS